MVISSRKPKAKPPFLGASFPLFNKESSLASCLDPISVLRARMAIKKKTRVGSHLMRVRIRKVVFRKLQEVAEEEAERTGQHVTVSDLVRVACANYLQVHDSLRLMENAPPAELDDEILVDMNPMLLSGPWKDD